MIGEMRLLQAFGHFLAHLLLQGYRSGLQFLQLLWSRSPVSRAMSPCGPWSERCGWLVVRHGLGGLILLLEDFEELARLLTSGNRLSSPTVELT